jgi:8-oxo-dGTP diphosphatase
MKKGTDYIGVGCGALIINEKNEILLVRRTSNTANEASFWSLPGGSVDFGEKVVDAIKREIKEELGVEIELTKFLGYHDHILEKENQHWVAIHYLAKIVSGIPQNLESEKHSEIRWFPIDELPKNITSTTSEPLRKYLESL